MCCSAVPVAATSKGMSLLQALRKHRLGRKPCAAVPSVSRPLDVSRLRMASSYNADRTATSAHQWTQLLMPNLLLSASPRRALRALGQAWASQEVMLVECSRQRAALLECT